MKIGIACDEGRAAAEVIDLLAAAGLPAAPLRGVASPALVTAAETTWLLAGAADVLAGCSHGGLDAAVAGKGVLLELEPGVSEVLDLGVCADALVYATPNAYPPATGRARPRVATPYPRVTQRYFAAAGRQVEALPFAAAALAPALGLAEGVVDLRTRLAVSGVALNEREQVALSSARLVVGRAARTLRARDIAELIARLRALLEGA